jgi:hypothetical protein
VSFLPLVPDGATVNPWFQRHRSRADAREDAMTRTPRTARWIRRPHRHLWVADTRDPEFSAGRLMGGYGRRS